MPRRPSVRHLRIPAVGLLAAAAATATTGLPAQAAPVPSGPRAVVAAGLDNPRHLAFGPDGTLYIAESGRGGAGPCATAPEGGTACFGLSGAVTSVRWTKTGVQQQRIITGLPSMAGQGDGSSASGPADVAVTGRGQIAVVIGLGGNPTTRAALGPAAATMGTVVKANLNRPNQLSVVADGAAYEAKANPDGGEVDSNPSSILRVGNQYVVTDSGGNDLVSLGGKNSTVAVFPDRIVSTPPGMGLPPQMPMQSVPTGVSIGPDGAYYVSQLTGFPFPKGASTIWRVVPGQAPTAYATGLTNVTDLTWAGGKLYAVQLATDGLLAAQGLPMGSLVEVSTTGTHRVLAANLPAPYGVAVSGGSAFVTTCTVCAGGGAVLRVPLG